MVDEVAGINDGRQSAILGVNQATGFGRRMLDFTLGVQKAFLDEIADARDESLERLRAEIDIGTEFVARMASAHSVHDIVAVCSDCGQHQADVLWRDSQLLLKHSQRLCERTSKLLSASTQQ